MKSSKPVYWRVPDSLTDIKSYLEDKITWFEVNDWLVDFKSDFLKIENKEIFDKLIQKGIEDFNYRLKNQMYKSGFDFKKQVFLKKYISFPVLLISSREKLIDFCTQLVKNIDSLTDNYTDIEKLNFDTAVKNLVDQFTLDILSMLEANNLEDDVKVASLLRELGFPIQSIMLLKENIDKKSRLIKCAATVDLVEIASEEEMSFDEIIEFHSPFSDIDQLKKEYLELISRYEEDLYTLKSYCRFLILITEDSGELYTYLLLLIDKIKNESLDSKKPIALLCLVALQLPESRNLSVSKVNILENFAETYKDIQLDEEKVALQKNFKLVIGRIKSYISNKEHEKAKGMIGHVISKLELNSNNLSSFQEKRLNLLNKLLDSISN
tara:strand:+ start:113 stop:1255 length:1143 start_codon:yes stop_codon:yes gene_type:complete